MLAQVRGPSTQAEEKLFRKPLSALVADLRTDRRLTRAWLLIEAEYPDPGLGLDRLGKAAGVSKDHLNVLCHQRTSFTLYQVLLRYRLFQAAILLVRPGPQRPSADVAIEVGFQGRNTFNRSFRTVMGVSPRAFAIANKNNLVFCTTPDSDW